MNGTSSPQEVEEILKALRRIVQGITLQSKQLFKMAGLTVPQILCLRAIEKANKDDITAAEVARIIRVSPATVTGIIDRLERNGLVVRERRSKDRRKICLNVTPKGQERLTTLPPSLQDSFIHNLETLAQDDRKDILKSLTTVVEMMEASSIDASPILAPGDLRTEIPEQE